MPNGALAALNGKTLASGSLSTGVYGCYATNAAAGIALVALTTSNHPTLWNPSNSGVALAIRRIILSQIADGANAPGCVIWGLTQNTGDAAATGSPIAAFTAITAGTFASSSGALASRFVGGNTYTPKARWAPAACTFTAAPTYMGPAGQTLQTVATATAANPHSTIIESSIVLAPGTAASLAYNTTTTTVKYQIHIDFDEILLG